MSIRSLVMFLISVALLRISGKRSFGKNSALDIIIGIMLGAILARGVVGASPYFSTVAAALVIAVAHRLIARISVSQHWLGSLVKGESQLLFRDGKLIWNGMVK